MVKSDGCTVCGVATEATVVLEKQEDGRGCGGVTLLRCPACNTVYLMFHNESYKDELYDYYEKYSGKPKGEIYNPLTRKSYALVLKLLARHTRCESILDVGCGKGDFVDYALDSGHDVQGIELAQPAVGIAQRFGLPVFRQDFFSNEIQESSRDVVTMFELIEHVPNPVDVSPAR